MCNKCLGVPLSDASACDIQGWVLCLSMCDAKAFGPFFPKDTDISRCLDMASEFWETMIALRDNLLNLNTIQTVQGLSPCAHRVFGGRIVHTSKVLHTLSGRIPLHSL